MSAEKHPMLPASLTMMGGPVDTREAPTVVNELATTRPHAWFEQNVIATVPYLYPGSRRKVYPGFLQLAGFMTMNLGSHLESHWSRSEEHTSELQSLMRISYAVFCLKKKKKLEITNNSHTQEETD